MSADDVDPKAARPDASSLELLRLQAVPLLLTAMVLAMAAQFPGASPPSQHAALSDAKSLPYMP